MKNDKCGDKECGSSRIEDYGDGLPLSLAQYLIGEDL